MGHGVGDLAALVASLAPFHGDGHELGGALAVAHDGLGQFPGHVDQGGAHFGPARLVARDEGHAGLAGGGHNEGIVGGGVAVHGDAVERLVRRLLGHRLQQALGDAGVGSEEAEHGGHVRADHAGALGDAGQGDGLAVHHHPARGSLGHRVGGHDAVGGGVPVVGLEVGNGRRQAGHQAIHGQGLEDHPGGERQHLARRHAELFGQGGAGGVGRGQPRGTGAGVGDAGVDHQGADACGAVPGRRQVAAAHLHRRGAEAVGGEHAGHGRAFGQGDHRQVAAVGLADAGLGNTKTDAGDGEQGFRSGSGVIDRHGRYLTKKKKGRRRRHEAPATAPSMHQLSLPWQCLNFLPLPQGQGSLRPTLSPAPAGRGAASASASAPDRASS